MFLQSQGLSRELYRRLVALSARISEVDSLEARVLQSDSDSRAVGIRVVGADASAERLHDDLGD